MPAQKLVWNPPGPDGLTRDNYLEPSGADMARIIAQMHYSFARWLCRRLGARRVRQVEIVPGEAAPSWNMRPRLAEMMTENQWTLADDFNRLNIVSRVTVGAGWLAANFPVTWARSRLLAEPFATDGIPAAEWQTFQAREAQQNERQHDTMAQ